MEIQKLSIFNLEILCEDILRRQYGKSEAVHLSSVDSV
jgi:hypothetical protein